MIGVLPTPRHATVAEFLGADGAPIDAGLALYFPTPDSFTGETVLELQGHGGPLVMSLLVDAPGNSPNALFLTASSTSYKQKPWRT
jgi:tRNA modification GTPase